MTFKTTHLTTAQAAALRRNVKWTIGYADLVAEGATTSAVATLLDDLAARSEISNVVFSLPTPFDGGATSALVLDVGVTGDDDAFIDNIEIHLDGTEIIASGPTLSTISTTTVDETYATPESTVLTNLRTLANQILAKEPKVLTATTDLIATFTATGGNLNVLTTGEVNIFAHVVDLSKF